MNSIPESWIQSVVEAAGLPPASPEVVNVLLPTIELQIRKIIQQAAKFQKRGKSSTLKGLVMLSPCYLFPSLYAI